MNRNWRRTVAVVSVPAGAAMAGSAILGGPAGFVAAAAVVVLVSCPALFRADRLALSAMQARPVGEVEYPELYRVVREGSRAARLPVPRVHVSPALQPNSFTIGRSRRTATVCWTEGLIRLLTLMNYVRHPGVRRADPGRRRPARGPGRRARRRVVRRRDPERNR